jgi:lipopolysaccharide transport system ATP-binding protein
MKNNAIIEAESLGKKYNIGFSSPGSHKYIALRDVIAEKAKNLGKNVIHPFSKNEETKRQKEEFWALKNVDFKVAKGERIGVIGRNGAGKSTLLKVLSRITEPTEGTVTIRGRVASLLEVGTGFHPELTGRENIFLNGAILGMSRSEIRKKFDEIVTFAEVERFLDTPVKHFSSGMYVRLAFSVAAHLEPEILLIDEVLAVGDAQFQKKCLGKMEDVSSQEGRTIMFVSHNMTAIVNLCEKTLLVDGGRVKFYGNTIDAINIYNEEIVKMALTWKGCVGNDYSKLLESWVIALDERGELFCDVPIEIGLTFEVLKPIQNFVLGFWIISEYNTVLAYMLHDDYVESPEEITKPGIYTKKFIIPKNTMAKGTYYIKVDIGSHNFMGIYQGTILSFSLLNRENIGCRFHTGDSIKFTSIFRPDWAVK